MKYRELIESPMADFETFGDMSREGSFRPDDWFGEASSKANLTELRRNPSVNKKIHVMDGLKKYAGKNVFVTFTDDVGSNSHERNPSNNARGAKIGINPQYYYNTPLGIYAYPVEHVLSKQGYVEFGGRRPYLWVFEPKGKLLDLNVYTMTDLQKDISKLRSINKLPNDIFHQAASSARVKTPGGMLWNITRVIAVTKLQEYIRQKVVLKKMKQIRHAESYYSFMDVDGDDWSQGDPDEVFNSQYHDDEIIDPNSMSEKDGAKQWGKVLKSLGYCGVVDSKGQKIIHPNEPTQAVFFSLRDIHVLELVYNIQPRPVSNRIDDFDDYLDQLPPFNSK